MRPADEIQKATRADSGMGLLSFLILVFLVGTAIGAAYWLYLDQPKAPESTSVSSAPDSSATPLYDFATTIDLPSSPVGLAWNGTGFLSANTVDPYGFMYIGHDDKGLIEVVNIPVTRNKQNLKIGFPGVTWDGKNYISMAARSTALNKHEEIFTIHDAIDLSIVRYTKAPKDIGCIGWDGTHYWAGTGREFKTPGEQGALFKLDKNLDVISETPIGMTGCQGLVWDGYRLVWADKFTNSLHLIDVSGPAPKAVHQYKTSTGKLGGLAYDEKHFWIADSDKNRIRRLDPRLQQQWLIEDYSIAEAGQLPALDSANTLQSEDQKMMASIKPLLREALDVSEVKGIVESLVMENGEKETAGLLKLAIPLIYDMNVKREVRKHFDVLSEFGEFSYTDDRPLADEAIQFSYLNVHIEDGALVGSWQIVVGNAIAKGLDSPPPEDISKPLQRFIRYSIYVKDDASSKPYKRDFEITSDEDIQDGYVLLDGLEHGRYVVRATMHAQYYVDGKGKSYTSSVTPHIVRY